MQDQNKIPEGGVQIFIEQKSLLQMIRSEGERIEKKFNFCMTSSIDDCETKEIAFELGAYLSLVAVSVMILAIGEASEQEEINQLVDEAKRSTKQ